MTGREFLTLAGKLAVMQQLGPAGERSAVSRAYYGVFHLAKELLEDLNIHIPRDENAHKKLVMYFANSRQTEAVSLATMIGDLHERRKRADYTIADTQYEGARFAQSSVERANAISDVLAKLAAEPRRSQLQQGVKAYLSPQT
jgi:uncharacterized protein (UPF0332 family)